MLTATIEEVRIQHRSKLAVLEVVAETASRGPAEARTGPHYPSKPKEHEPDPHHSRGNAEGDWAQEWASLGLDKGASNFRDMMCVDRALVRTVGCRLPATGFTD